MAVFDPKAVSVGTVYGVTAVNQWRVSDVRLRYDVVKNGIGWGFILRPMIEADLAPGDLVELKPMQMGFFQYHAAFQNSRGPAQRQSIGASGHVSVKDDYTRQLLGH